MAFSVGLFLVALLGLSLFPGHRKLMLIAGILAVPLGALEVFFIPEYWQPRRVTTLLFGPEDALFSFATGLLACLLAYRFLGVRLRWRIDPVQLLGRYALLAGVFLGILVVLRWLDLRMMTAALVSMLCAGALLLAARKDLRRVPLFGGLGFATLYFLLLRGAYWIWPHFSSEWSPNLWGLDVMSVPLEELFWALLYGGIYPCAVVYLLSVRALPAQQPA